MDGTDETLEQLGEAYSDLAHRAERLCKALRNSIEDWPDHPWIPGTRFKDGELLAALASLRELVDH